jgi:hypothetical protein
MGTLPGDRIRNIDEDGIKALLRSGPVRFVVANCGSNLRWIPVEETFDFWKRIRHQIAKPSSPIHLEKYPNETAYIASQWRGQPDRSLILLEAHH